MQSYGLLLKKWDKREGEGTHVNVYCPDCIDDLRGVFHALQLYDIFLVSLQGNHGCPGLRHWL